MKESNDTFRLLEINMVIACPKCSTRFVIADEKIKGGNTKVRCSKCKEVFPISAAGEKNQSAEKNQEKSSANRFGDLSAGLEFPSNIGQDVNLDFDIGGDNMPNLSSDILPIGGPPRPAPAPPSPAQAAAGKAKAAPNLLDPSAEEKLDQKLDELLGNEAFRNVPTTSGDGILPEVPSPPHPAEDRGAYIIAKKGDSPPPSLDVVNPLQQDETEMELLDSPEELQERIDTFRQNPSPPLPSTPIEPPKKAGSIADLFPSTIPPIKTPKLSVIRKRSKKIPVFSLALRTVLFALFIFGFLNLMVYRVHGRFSFDQINMITAKAFILGTPKSSTTNNTATAFRFRNSKSTLIQNTKNEMVLVVSGDAVNQSPAAVRDAKIKVTIYSITGIKVTEKDGDLGLILTRDQIFTLTNEESLDALLKSKNEGSIVIAPGGSIPFQVLFFHPPKQWYEFSVSVTSSRSLSGT